MKLSVGEYFSRPAEQLVLEGYRYWSNGHAIGSVEPWVAAKDLFLSTLGTENGRLALTSLSNFMAVLGACASCPLKTHAYGVKHLCRDEVLILGLISGIQYDDSPTIFLCLKHLSCATQCENVAAAAGEFALVLKTMDKLLLPIPAEVIRNIISAEYQTNPTHLPNSTLH